MLHTIAPDVVFLHQPVQRHTRYAQLLRGAGNVKASPQQCGLYHVTVRRHSRFVEARAEVVAWLRARMSVRRSNSRSTGTI